MSFSPVDLQLRPDRQTQITEALANGEVADPLQKLCDEASTDVARLTAGYVLPQSSIDAWIRTIVLYKAYLIAELGVPKDLSEAFATTMRELQSISRGEQKNLPLAAASETPPVKSGSFGSNSKIPIRL